MTTIERRYAEKMARALRVVMCASARGVISINCYDIAEVRIIREIVIPILGPRLMERVEFHYRDYYRPPKE